jgi:hypothetical protein
MRWRAMFRYAYVCVISGKRGKSDRMEMRDCGGNVGFGSIIVWFFGSAISNDEDDDGCLGGMLLLMMIRFYNYFLLCRREGILFFACARLDVTLHWVARPRSQFLWYAPEASVCKFK